MPANNRCDLTNFLLTGEYGDFLIMPEDGRWDLRFMLLTWRKC